MKDADGKDPTRPWVTFDNYIVQEPSKAQFDVPKERTKAFLMSVAAVWVLTFTLGVLTTLSFMGGREQLVEASVVPSGIEQIVAAPALPEEAPVADTSVSVGDPVPDRIAGLVEASLGSAVTRTSNSDLLGTVGPMSRVAEDGPTYAEILKGLGMRGAPAESGATRAEISQDKLRLIREGVLNGTYTVKAIERKGRERLCLRLENADVSRQEVEMILQTAMENGEFEVPEALRQEGGEADIDTLLFNFIQTSLASDGTAEGSEAAVEMSRRAFMASKAKTSKDKKGRIYVVEPGDSLAYISLQFYGRPSDYEKIFQANRTLLKSPDQIQVGQRLIIPG